MPDIRSDALVIHGERDETIALSAVLDWLRPQDVPVVVLPGADHFFHRRLGALKQLVMRHVLGAQAVAASASSPADPFDG
jgi:alpha/beta superfamily hydrolase